MRKGDRIVILILLFVTLFVAGQYLYSHSNKVLKKEVIIRSDGKVIKRIALNDATKMMFTVKSKEGFLIVQINNERVRVIKSTCRDKLCMKQGWIDRPGESIVCLPNRISITIQGEKNGVDSVTY